MVLKFQNIYFLKQVFFSLINLEIHELPEFREQHSINFSNLTITESMFQQILTGIASFHLLQQNAVAGKSK
jgi:hypothetical protein